MTARAKGVREKQVLWRHAVPNALLPTLTLTLLSLRVRRSAARSRSSTSSPGPGLGWLTVQAIDAKDFPLLQGLFLLFSARGDHRRTSSPTSCTRTSTRG